MMTEEIGQCRDNVEILLIWTRAQFYCPVRKDGRKDAGGKKQRRSGGGNDEMKNGKKLRWRSEPA
jgi:hypothetical protein